MKINLQSQSQFNSLGPIDFLVYFSFLRLLSTIFYMQQEKSHFTDILQYDAINHS